MKYLNRIRVEAALREAGLTHMVHLLYKSKKFRKAWKKYVVLKEKNKKN